jgi:hypothetical protein
METKTFETEKIERHAFDYIITIDMGNNIAIIEITPYLGNKVTYVALRDKKSCVPQIRTVMPIWTWRKIKRMLDEGKDINKFLYYAIKMFILLNLPDTTIEQRKYINHELQFYKEPERLLALL